MWWNWVLKGWANNGKWFPNLTPAPMRIDSHQHFWTYQRERDVWITDEMRVIQRNFYPDQLAPLLNENQIDGCVSVQADQSEAETRFLLEWAHQYKFIKGVVGWMDLQSPHIEERLNYFTQYAKLKGVRHVVQAEPDGFLFQTEFQRGIAALRTHHLTYDLLIKEHQLEEAVEFVKMFPAQKIVVDHLAKPRIGKGDRITWAKQMTALAACDNVYCKLSGMVTEANWKTWKPEDFTPYLDAVLEAFGPQRVMYGSDWPVCLVAASYQDQFNIITHYISRFSDSEKQAILGANAIQFYNL